MTESAFEIRCGNEIAQVSPHLLERYDVAGPRYTSYPTAPEWSDTFGSADAVRALRETASASRPLSLYVHLPFCERLCLYCGCNVVIRRNHDLVSPYLARLGCEIDRVAASLGPDRVAQQLHWGGGTPTYLAPEELEILFGHLSRRFRFADGAELGVEIDPRVTTPEHLKTLRRLGFNRLSLGIQDFDPKVQRTVRRVQSVRGTRELYDLARGEGFESINVDLIYGLPHQTIESFARTLDLVIAMAPDRIASYSYAHVPWLRKQQGAFARHLPGAREKFALFIAALERFTGAGYRFVGFDHFARETDELCAAREAGTLTRNFQGYSTHGDADLIGLGVSSISGLDNAYIQNARDLAGWQTRIDAGELATIRGLWLDAEDRLRREVIQRLLCHGRLRKKEIEERFDIAFDVVFAPELGRLRELEEDGLVCLSREEISVTLLGRIFLRVVGMAFDAYLARRDPEQPLFSRTI